VKNFPNKIFSRYAIHTLRQGLNTFYFFDTSLDIESFKDMISRKCLPEKIARGAQSEVSIYPQWVLKNEHRSIKKRLSYLYLGAHNVRGHYGIIGEAVNTLVANYLNHPSHRLAGVHINYLTGKASALYSRVNDLVLFSDLLKESDIKHEELVTDVIHALIKTLDIGIMHGDCNISNIFYGPVTQKAEKKIQLIDLELAIPVNCEKSIAAATMLSNFYDERLQKFFQLENFIELLEKILPEHFSRSEIKNLIALFTHYARPLKRHEREERLNRVSNYKPALAQLLING
jgi:hypothetical protein